MNLHPSVNKTNKRWYPFPDLGSWFRLEEGTLLFSPLLVDGACLGDDESGEVDFDRIDTADALLMRVVRQDLTKAD